LAEDAESESIEDARDSVEDRAEESSETQQETSDTPSGGDEGDPDLSGLLEQIPEEYRPLAERYGQGRVSGLQRSLTPKLEEAARLREKAAIPDQFEENLRKDPRAVIESLKRHAREQGWLTEKDETKPDTPQPPGDMPDPVNDPDEFREWYERSRAYDQHLLEQRIAKEREALAPMKETVRKAQIAEARAATKAMIEADDDEMNEVDAIAAEIRGDVRHAPKVLLELVRLRKAVAAQNKTTRKTSEEAARGIEERPGLPRTGARKTPPKETGDLKKDVLAELEHDGIPFED
jgi:hypothetical protein